MVPIVYPVLHALIFSYLFIIYVITHAWTSPGKYSRDRERSFFLDITPPHLQYTTTPSLPPSSFATSRHTRTHTERERTNAHVHTREEAKLTRSSLLWKRSAVQSSRGSLFVDSFSSTRKWERIERGVVPCVSWIDPPLASHSRRYIYIYKITHTASRCE